MTISKIVLTGQVLRSPEKRFTENNLTITTFTMNFSEDSQEKIIRVSSFGKLADKTAEIVKKDQTVIVEGRLQTNSTKTDAGVEKKYFEITAQGIEIIDKSGDTGESSGSAGSSYEEKEFSLSDEIDTDDLIGEDEIPF